MVEIKFVLPMDIGEVNVLQQSALIVHFLVKLRSPKWLALWHTSAPHC